MIKNRKLRLALYTVLPSILLYLAWPPRDLFFLSFFALVPFLFLEEETKDSKGYGWLVYLGLILFNLLNTWWVYYASPVGSIVMLFANSWLMFIPFWAYRKARNVVSTNRALLLFVCLWLAYEYLHLNWQITWPWLMLGNVFAKHNAVIQWYEYTGAMGGSLWVLASNVFLYKALQKRSWKRWLAPASVIVVPIVVSFFILTNYTVTTKPNGAEVLLVQPNIDPYNKFDKSTEISNLIDMLEMVEKEISPRTQYVVMPETAVVEYMDEDRPYSHQSMQILRKFLELHPQVHIVTGVSSYNFYDEGEKRSPTARETAQGDYYESYNTAMEIAPDGEITLHHKMKLVPGAEKMPYPRLFGFLEYFSIDMGGISGSLGSDKEAVVFEAGEKPEVAALICYESVFPELVSDFVVRGADLLFVITNDGWWRDTDGYKQHMYYASLRAIENRREVLRSANTGITCRIDKTGKIIERTNWWEPKVLKVEAVPARELTVYSRLGDVIGALASFVGVFFFLSIMVQRRLIRNG